MAYVFLEAKMERERDFEELANHPTVVSCLKKRRTGKDDKNGEEKRQDGTDLSQVDTKTLGIYRH